MTRLAGLACGGDAVRFAAVRIGTLIAIHRWNRGPLRTSVSLVSLSAFLLLGCVSEYNQQGSRPQSAKSVIPLPERALMQPQGEPGCELEASQEKSSEGAEQRHPPAREWEPNRKQGQGDPNATLGLRVRLEYERDCFRRAESQTRDRLHRLQAAVGKTIKTVKRIERNGF